MHSHDGNRSTPQVPECDRVAGDRLVCFDYCISLIVVTLRRTSGVHRLRPRELGLLKGLPFTLLTLLLGWWGVPWGIIYTPLALLTNLSGGRDATGLFHTRRTCELGKM
jgi:hypothetical protein